MKSETRLIMAFAGGTILLGIIACLVAFRKNIDKKNKMLQPSVADNDVHLNEENELEEAGYEPVSSWLL